MPRIPATSRQVTCPGCGAFLRYAPGTLSLECDHCGSHVPLPEDEAEAAFGAMLDGKLADEDIARFLVALSDRGETSE